MQCNRFLRGPAISITGQLANLRDTLGYEAQWSLINLVRRWP